MLNTDILEKARQWASNPYFDTEDRKIVQSLLDTPEKNAKELAECFHQDLTFGTGGLRSIIGIGSNRMNKYNVRRATQALCDQIIESFADSDNSACVSYDSRKFSLEFAKEVACVFAANGIKAFIYNKMTPVPLLSYAVRNKKSKAGVMITASHNPKIYNGFKCFWEDGCQVVPPVDQKIIDKYNSLTDWNNIKYINFDKAMDNGLIQWMPDQVIEDYFQVIINQMKRIEMCQEHGGKLNVVYTPIHGTGFWACKDLADRLGFTNFNLVSEQAVPDSDFPTVPSPNPENPAALAMAVEQMRASNADIVFGTDPDTDRLGVAYIENDEVVYLNGNQIAVLMLDYIFESLEEKNKIPKNPLVIKSIVTSELQTAIANHYNARIESTLTGFKWMGALLKSLENNKIDFDFIFASEESFGYMGHCETRDKDGVSAMALMLETTLFHKLAGRNLTQALDRIYTKYGFYQESLVSLDYLGIEGAQKIERIMSFFRDNRPQDIASDKIVKVEDYLHQTITNLTNNDSQKIDQPKSNVLGFTFESGNKLYLRPSGTEPKIKFYTMVKSEGSELKAMKSRAYATIEKIEKYIHQTTESI